MNNKLSVSTKPNKLDKAKAMLSNIRHDIGIIPKAIYHAIIESH